MGVEWEGLLGVPMKGRGRKARASRRRRKMGVLLLSLSSVVMVGTRRVVVMEGWEGMGGEVLRTR